MALGVAPPRPNPPAKNVAFCARVKKSIREAKLLAMSDTMFVEAERLEQFATGCRQTNNPDGAACWQRMANHARTEAKNFALDAKKLTGKRS
ncbi:hypothetical protein [Acetobacter cibinongensis]|uniref:Uncharacterized protein n=1 Tax=Acetobacter cibinongensis TaxID=146475 RepID=A0A1Z5YW29_9PROT|nr:hypothetical protein [Acetobacter cibinongensis]OUJ03173.1 hypothetical protein HK14_03135 [Acetobacter cibinongensis]